MKLAQVLDVFEGLLVASEHPDIVQIDRYGTSTEPWGPDSGSPGITGVRVRYQSTATASLWGAVWPGEKPIPLPETMPPPRRRAARLAIFAVQLLETARPKEFRSWQLVTLPGLGLDTEQDTLPSGVSLVCADGTKMLLRVTATGETVGGAPEEEPAPNYVIPDRVRTWQLADARSVGPS